MSNIGHDPDTGKPTTCTDPGCVAAAEHDWPLGPHMSVDAKGYVTFHHEDDLHEEVVRGFETEFAETCAAFSVDPTDFATAWYYLSCHPIFHRPEAGSHKLTPLTEISEEDLENAMSYIVRDDGLRDMWTNVSRGDDGTITVALEHGPHYWPADIAENEHWCFTAAGAPTHDVSLDTYAPTFEQAIVILAGKVRDKYGDTRDSVAQKLSSLD